MGVKLFLLFNHTITQEQKEAARASLGVEKIVSLPPKLKERWRNIPPDLPEIAGYLEPIRKWLRSEAAENDYVLIQGDFGACYLMVGHVFELGLIPVYSTTRREALEKHGDNGSVRLTHHFKHKIFRRYGV